VQPLESAYTVARTRTSNTTGRLWIEEGEQRVGLIAEVAPLIRTDRTYSYAVPDELAGSLQLGQRVTVPLGKSGRPVIGFVVGIAEQPWDSTLRTIAGVVDDRSFLPPDLIRLGREIAEHYDCPLGRTLKAITPEGVRRERGLRTVRYVKLAEAVAEADRKLGPKQAAVIEVLRAADAPVELSSLLDRANASQSVLRAMVKAGLVEVKTRKELGPDAPGDTTELVEPGFTLNEAQEAALAGVLAAAARGKFSVTLLHGVAGSGKTEIYIHAMRRVIAEGKQAILLVPEIVLTTQLVKRLASRFPDVAVNHSGLTDSRRSVIWRQVAAGFKTVVIGTRSAVFAPCTDLGLICVDEEQETSYKNLQSPRFHVRDVAIMRAKQLGIPVVLGSATPSVETWYHSAHRADYCCLTIGRRVRDLAMPKVAVIDMENEWAETKSRRVLSRTMEGQLDATLERGEQAIVLMNRRGFAHRLHCPSCKARITCPNCNVGLVPHSSTGQSICHYCRSRIVTPTVCPDPSCGARLVSFGVGTQRVEEVLGERFPEARVARVDSDTMTHRRDYQRIVDDFESRKIDVLIGTQMIAKGLDFPFVSFVGVIHADAGAMSADFRANERLFQLITQVSGRAGRSDAPGTVVVQTTSPQVSALHCALNHDYESFAKEELETRKMVGLPPFRRLARIVLSHERDRTVEDEARAMADRIHDVISSMGLNYADVLGPSPCVLARLKGRYRHDLMIRTHSAGDLRRLIAELNRRKALATKARSIIVDVDPVAMT